MPSPICAPDSTPTAVAQAVIGATALLEPATGIGVYTREIATRLPALLPNLQWQYQVGEGLVVPTLPLADPAPPARQSLTIQARRWIGTAPLFGPLLRDAYHRLRLLGDRRRFDLYWEPNNLLDLRLRARATILTVHDFSWRNHPEWHPCERVAHFRRAFDRSLRRADTVITGSHRTREEILATTSLQAEQVVVIHHGVDQALFHPWSADAISALRQRLSLPERFVLFVGTLEPRKNLATLLTAWSHLPAAVQQDLHLVIVGAKGWRNTDLHRAIAAFGERIHCLGYVPREDLPGLYSAAAVFAYPSTYEGFGLPPVEAAACGCPLVIAHDLPAREVLGQHGFAIDPLDPGAIADAIVAAVASPRIPLHPPGWDQAAQAHARILQAFTSDT